MCEASVISPHLQFTILSGSLPSVNLIPPLRINCRSKFSLSACGVLLSEPYRSYAEAKGEGQGAHMAKESRGLPLLLGRLASPRGLPDPVNHFLSLMRSKKFQRGRRRHCELLQDE